MRVDEIYPYIYQRALSGNSFRGTALDNTYGANFAGILKAGWHNDTIEVPVMMASLVLSSPMKNYYLYDLSNPERQFQTFASAFTKSIDYYGVSYGDYFMVAGMICDKNWNILLAPTVIIQRSPEYPVILNKIIGLGVYVNGKMIHSAISGGKDEKTLFTKYILMAASRIVYRGEEYFPKVSIDYTDKFRVTRDLSRVDNINESINDFLVEASEDGWLNTVFKGVE